MNDIYIYLETKAKDNIEIIVLTALVGYILIFIYIKYRYNKYIIQKILDKVIIQDKVSDEDIKLISLITDDFVFILPSYGYSPENKRFRCVSSYYLYRLYPFINNLKNKEIFIKIDYSQILIIDESYINTPSVQKQSE